MKRIAYYVIAMHLFFVLWSALWMPSKKVDKKPLQVRTVVHAPPPKPVVQAVVKSDVRKVAAVPSSQPKPAPAVQKSAPKPQRTAPPKPTAKKVASAPAAPAKKAAPAVKSSPVIPANLVQQLQESIAKIDQTSHKDSPKQILPAPKKWVPQLKIDEECSGEESFFVSSLIERLQETLDLPEIGEVKVELVLKRDGSFVKMKVVHSASEKNKKFLEQELKTVTFPPFSGDLKDEKEHTFVITFCNS